VKLEPPVRRLALATALVAATSALTLVGHADTVRPTKGAHRFTTTDALVPVLDGPSNAHAVSIDTRLYVPDNATARSPQPAILMTHGFGLSKTSPEVTSMATFLAAHGYVVLTYTSQGFGKSGGCIALQSRTYDVKDAQQLITKVLQTKPYVKKDRKGAVVGTVGGSYGGGIQANLAEADPRVRAINPYRTWNTLQYSLDPNNWVVPGDRTGFTHTLAPQGVFKRSWTTLLSGSGLGQPVGGLPPTGNQNGACPQDKVASADAAGLACTGFRLEVCETLARLEATGDADAAAKALVADSSATTQIGRLRVPTLLVQGQSDTLFNLNDAVATYTQLRRQGTPVQMIWNSGGHGGYDSLPGECEVYGGGTTGLDQCYLPLRTLAFFDHWLRGTPDRSPGFSYFRDWVPYSGKGPTTQYGDAPAFPTGSTFTLTLSGTGDLVVHHPVAGSVQVVNPGGGLPSSYSELSNFTGPGSSPNASQLPPGDAPGTVASFVSGPLAQPLVSVGVPSARLRLSHVARSDLYLFGKVYDVDGAGNATLIHRLVAPIRVPTIALDPWVDVKLLGFAHRFPAGHRIRVDFSATDASSYNNPQPDVITLTTGLGTFFTLPTTKG
jgi:ABC-2 type transport system ATP-binding protein